MNKSAMNVYVGHKRKACCLGWEEQEILLFIEKGPHRRKDWREVVWEGCGAVKEELLLRAGEPAWKGGGSREQD